MNRNYLNQFSAHTLSITRTSVNGRICVLGAIEQLNLFLLLTWSEKKSISIIYDKHIGIIYYRIGIHIYFYNFSY